MGGCFFVVAGERRKALAERATELGIEDMAGLVVLPQEPSRGP